MWERKLKELWNMSLETGILVLPEPYIGIGDLDEKYAP